MTSTKTDNSLRIIKLWMLIVVLEKPLGWAFGLRIFYAHHHETLIAFLSEDWI